jgi:hypothetical protein
MHQLRRSPHHRSHGTSIALFLCGAVAACITAVAAHAAPMTMNFYCTANVPQTHTRYLTAIFPAAATKGDVISAWRLYLESQNINAGEQFTCDAGVNVADMQALVDISRQSAANLKSRVVDVDWKFAGQVPASEPNKVYGYCQSGTSVVSTTYFSDIFGVTVGQAMSNPEVHAAFFEYVRATYGKPPGLAIGAGPGPNGEWCVLIGNIADAERDKATWEAKLKSSTRQIVETGWRYDVTPPP